MRKISLVILMTITFFFLEFLFFNFFGRWLHPNFLILLIIFINSYLGIRYALLVAIVGGLLKDSFSVGVFGVYLVSFIFCAYVSTLIRRYFYELEVDILRILTTFLISALNGLIVCMLYAACGTVDFASALRHLILPEVLITTLIAIFTFNELKKCVLKLSV